VPRKSTLTAMTAAVVLIALPATVGAQTASQRAEGNMIQAINKVRGQHGFHALRPSSSLMESAGRFSHWLMSRDTFGHLSRIPASSRFSLLGEALAMHSGRKFRVRRTLSRWMGSPSHRAIVLSPTMRWLGTGVTRGRMGAMPATVWVLHTGRLRPGGPSLPSLPSLP
jgi:uncharacterized protein YkwD